MNTCHTGGILAGICYDDAQHIPSSAIPSQDVGSAVTYLSSKELRPMPVPIPCPSPSIASDFHVICLAYRLRIVRCLHIYIYMLYMKYLAQPLAHSKLSANVSYHCSVCLVKVLR